MGNDDFEISPAELRFGEELLGEIGENLRGDFEYAFAIHVE